MKYMDKGIADFRKNREKKGHWSHHTYPGVILSPRLNQIRQQSSFTTKQQAVDFIRDRKLMSKYLELIQLSIKHSLSAGSNGDNHSDEQYF